MQSRTCKPFFLWKVWLTLGTHTHESQVELAAVACGLPHKPVSMDMQQKLVGSEPKSDVSPVSWNEDGSTIVLVLVGLIASGTSWAAFCQSSAFTWRLIYSLRQGSLWYKCISMFSLAYPESPLLPKHCKITYLSSTSVTRMISVIGRKSSASHASVLQMGYLCALTAQILIHGRQMLFLL